jgi:hypothetical protein
VLTDVSYPVVARSEAWVCGRSFAMIVVLNPADDMGVRMSVMIVVWCQVEITASG